MKRFSTIAISAFAALAILAASAQTPAQAGNREGRVVAGILLGAIGGAIIASEINRNHNRRQYGHRYHSDHVFDDDIYVEPRKPRRVRHGNRLNRWQRHVRRCERKYRSYDRRSDTYITRSGRERVCRL